MKRSLRPASMLVGLAMFLLLWQVLAWIVHRPVLPGPAVVVPLFFRSLWGVLGLHLLASMARVLCAIVLSVILAVPAGVGLGQFKQVDRIFSPLIAILYPIPKIVLLPVMYILIGISDVSKVILIALILFFQVLVVVRDEAAALHPELIQSVRSLGAGRKALFRYVYLPASLPAVLTAIRVSVGTAIAVLFIAEQSLTSYGLGYYIVVETYQVLRYPEMYAGILAMGFLGILLYLVVGAVERRVNRHLYAEEG